FTFSGSTISTMKPDLQLPYVQSWNIGVQREIAPTTVVEVRYLGNRGSHEWRTYNVNEVNIFENGFLDEFKRAQNNLAINTANGRAGFANNGSPGQAPLPIFEAAFGPRGSQPALAAGSGFANGAFVTNLQQGTAGALANTLANYTLSKAQTDIWADNATQMVNFHTLRDTSLDRGPSPFDVRNVLQTFWTCELPFGPGHSRGHRNAAVRALAGGWTLSGVLTLQ